jgi:acetylornithine deacetylase
MDVVSMTRELVAFDSVTRKSNRPIAERIGDWLAADDFDVETLAFHDENGVEKVSVVGRKGPGNGGLALISHSDTVPADEYEGDPFSGEVREGRLHGRGSCDMKGPLAATIAAAARFRAVELARPILVVVTADEETTGAGATQVAQQSRLLQGTRYAVIAEPTRLIPVYAHKGGVRMDVVARGRAAHSSTGEGVNANFLIAPFLAEMAALAERFRREERYRNSAFDPPTNGWNMVIDDGQTASNVTAAKSVCTLSFRPTPGHPTQEIVDHVRERAAHYGLEFSVRGHDAYSVSPDSPVVQAALALTGSRQPETVSYGTDAVRFPQLEMVVLGPGDIRQAHTVNEWIDLDQLRTAVDVYSGMIRNFCEGSPR